MNMQIKDVIDLECMYVILLETNKANEFINKKYIYMFMHVCLFFFYLVGSVPSNHGVWLYESP